MSKNKARPRRQKARKGLLLASFLLLPVTMFYFSPYLIIDGGSHGLIVASFLVFSALFLVSLVALVKGGSMEDPECNLCGECADSCPKKVISYRFGRPAG